MIELIQDQYTSANKARPKMRQTCLYDIVGSCIEENDLELNMRMFIEEAIQFFGYIHLMEVNDVVEMLDSDQFPDFLVHL